MSRSALGLMFVGFASAVGLSSALTRFETQAAAEADVADRLPAPQVSRAMSLQHPLAGADLCWLEVVQRVGRPKLSSSDWDQVERYADVATDLDPLYFGVFKNVATVLSVIPRRFMSADRFLLKGLETNRREWELPFLLGYNAYFAHDDPISASRWLKQAADMEGAPGFIGALAGRAMFQSGDLSTALAILDSLEDTALDAQAHQDISDRRRVLLSEQRFKVYDRLCRTYLLRMGTLPSGPSQATALEWTIEPPFDFFDDAIYFDASCVARSNVVSTREFEAAAMTQVIVRKNRRSPAL